MTEDTIAHPKIVSREEWSVAREALLAQEKALTRHPAGRKSPRMAKELIVDG